MYDIKRASKYFCDDDDRSVVSPERQLFLRIEELESRLDDIKGQSVNDYDRISEEDMLYALPEFFMTKSGVKNAIAAVKSELMMKYGIDADKFRINVA